ncbi:MAG TPA: TAT-variant-translocated molybdopterin oxidoreductase, partial [Planctomycetota bacterium]|nr:TAT-variant-translocated molybdopterin oxidoreductase [Planctomycetota bacterium]
PPMTRPTPPADDRTPHWEEQRRRLQRLRGREYWKSLEELSDAPEFRQFLRRELSRPLSPLTDGMDRREFITLLGAALALAGFSGCGRPPDEKIIPYVRQPEALTPGKPLYFATAMPQPGGATGLLVRSDMGRPTKVEGNPRHPASLGGTDAFAQASVYSLWDPDRSQAITRAGIPSTWSEFLGALGSALEAPRARKGEGLAILTEEVLSPSLAAQMERLLEALPEARWHTYEPVGREGVRAGSLLAFGEDLEPVYRLSNADVVVSLDSDFLSCGPGKERYAHDYTSRRRVTSQESALSRLYVIESALTPTGSMADHRWAVRSSDCEAVARSLASALGLPVAASASGSELPWIAPLVRDLRPRRGRSLVIAGRDQPPAVHALAAAVNDHLGNAGKTVDYIAPVPFRSKDRDPSIHALAESMEAGRTNVLIILGGNPVYTAPAELDFERLLSKVGWKAHLGATYDETSWLCNWHVPEVHFLETWSDALAYDGTASIVQPLISPLYEGKSAHELISAMAGEIGRRPYDVVRRFWQRHPGADDFEKFWSLSLHEGLIAGTARPTRQPTPRLESLKETGRAGARPGELELVFRPDPAVWDGRFANNAWLQELPKPLTKLTWENAALVGPREAGRLNLSSNDVVELSFQGRTIEAPVWILPGHADGSVTVHLGYGRPRSGRIGSGLGFNAYALRSGSAPLFGLGLGLHKTGKKARLASTQIHHSMEGREPVRVTTAQKYAGDPNVVKHPEELKERPTL